MRIWLYYAGAGGGHKASVQAVAEEFLKQKSDAQFSWFDVGILAGAYSRRWFENGYAGLVHHLPWLYAFLYEASKLRPVMWLHNTLAEMLVGNALVRSLQTENPDLIVSSYFLVGPLVRALKKTGRAIPLVVIVTDPYSAPPIWFYYPELKYVVASAMVKKTALTRGVPEKNIVVVPQIIHGAPSRQKSVDKEGKIVLLVGGGNGFPGAEDVVNALVQSDVVAKIVVVCGTNEKLKKEIEAVTRQTKKQITVYGFVDFLPELIVKADVVIAKAGAGVVHEVLQQKKPLIISHFIWGQETGNKDFVVNNGLGFYEPKAKNIPALVQRCLYDADVLAKLEKACQEHLQKNGVSEVVTYLTSLTKGA